MTQRHQASATPPHALSALTRLSQVAILEGWHLRGSTLEQSEARLRPASTHSSESCNCAYAPWAERRAELSPNRAQPQEGPAGKPGSWKWKIDDQDPKAREQEKEIRTCARLHGPLSRPTLTGQWPLPVGSVAPWLKLQRLGKVGHASRVSLSAYFGTILSPFARYVRIKLIRIC
jgi:hypothetical protein